MPSRTVISLKNVSFHYPDSGIILDDISLAVESGDFLAIVGPNGGGKSTLLKIILNLLTPTSGEVLVLGEKPSRASSQIGYVPQFRSFRNDFPINVRQVITMGGITHRHWWGGYSKSDLKAADEIIEKLNLSAIADSPVNNLSGGQMQRVLIARAIVSKPKILILDEPTASIDPAGEQGIFDLFQQLNKQMTILLVSHDVGFVSNYINRVACINRKLFEHDKSRLTMEDLHDLYGFTLRHLHHDHDHDHNHEHSHHHPRGGR